MIFHGQLRGLRRQRGGRIQGGPTTRGKILGQGAVRCVRGGSEIKFDSVFLAGSWRARANNFEGNETFEPDSPQRSRLRDVSMVDRGGLIEFQG